MLAGVYAGSDMIEKCESLVERGGWCSVRLSWKDSFVGHWLNDLNGRLDAHICEEA